MGLGEGNDRGSRNGAGKTSRAWRNASNFMSDLRGGISAVQRVLPASRPGSASGRAHSPGSFFDAVVHHGADLSKLSLDAGLSARLPGLAGSHWDVVVRPGSLTSRADLGRGALVIARALGEGRLASVRVLGEDIQVAELYGPDGRIRPSVLVLRPRGQSDGTFALESAMTIEARDLLPAAEVDYQAREPLFHENLRR